MVAGRTGGRLSVERGSRCVSECEGEWPNPSSAERRRRRSLCCRWEQQGTLVSSSSKGFSLHHEKVPPFLKIPGLPGKRQWKWPRPSILCPPVHLAPSDQWTLYVNTDQCTVGEPQRYWVTTAHIQPARSPALSPIVADQSQLKYSPSNKGWGADIDLQETKLQKSSRDPPPKTTTKAEQEFSPTGQ